jgi:hypothetical protein
VPEKRLWPWPRHLTHKHTSEFRALSRHVKPHQLQFRGGEGEGESLNVVVVVGHPDCYIIARERAGQLVGLLKSIVFYNFRELDVLAVLVLE